MTQVTTEIPGSSTRPYLIRALHDWCTDNGFTPYLAVHVDRSVQVPMEYVKNNEIVLNVGFEATSGLKLGNDFIEFRARFGGMARDILVPVDHVVAIYARENGQGMAFPMPSPVEDDADAAAEPAGNAPRGLRLAPAVASSDEEDDEGGDELEEGEEGEVGEDGATVSDETADPPDDPPRPPSSPRPALKRIK
jgi:stringent starvation protein B